MTQKIRVITDNLKRVIWDNRIRDIQEIKKYICQKENRSFFSSDFEEFLDKIINDINYHLKPNDLPFGCYPDNNYGFIKQFKDRLKTTHETLKKEGKFFIKHPALLNMFSNMDWKLKQELEAIDEQSKVDT